MCHLCGWLKLFLKNVRWKKIKIQKRWLLGRLSDGSFVQSLYVYFCRSFLLCSFFRLAGNGWGYVACPIGSGRFPYPPDKFTLKQDNFLIDQPWGMRCTLCWCLYFSSLSQSFLRSPVRWPNEIFARWNS